MEGSAPNNNNNEKLIDFWSDIKCRSDALSGEIDPVSFVNERIEYLLRINKSSFKLEVFKSPTMDKLESPCVIQASKVISNNDYVNDETFAITKETEMDTTPLLKQNDTFSLDVSRSDKVSKNENNVVKENNLEDQSLTNLMPEWDIPYEMDKDELGLPEVQFAHPKTFACPEELDKSIVDDYMKLKETINKPEDTTFTLKDDNSDNSHSVPNVNENFKPDVKIPTETIRVRSKLPLIPRKGPLKAFPQSINKGTASATDSTSDLLQTKPPSRQRSFTKAHGPLATSSPHSENNTIERPKSERNKLNYPIQTMGELPLMEKTALPNKFRNEKEPIKDLELVKEGPSRKLVFGSESGLKTASSFKVKGKLPVAAGIKRRTLISIPGRLKNRPGKENSPKLAIK